MPDSQATTSNILEFLKTLCSALQAEPNLSIGYESVFDTFVKSLPSRDSAPASGESGPYRDDGDGYVSGPDGTSMYGDIASVMAEEKNAAYAAGRASVQGVAGLCRHGCGRVRHVGDCQPPAPTPDLRGALEECVKALEIAVRLAPTGGTAHVIGSALINARRELGGGA